MPNVDPLRCLTPAQKEVLRLVARGMSSKEIATHLNIKTASVDDRIDAAREKLGGVRRATAARLLLEAEETPPPFGATPPSFGGEETGGDQQERPVAIIGGSMMEQRAVFHYPGSVPLIDRLDGRMRSGAIVFCAISFLAFLALLKPMADGAAWLVAITERFFQ